MGNPIAALREVDDHGRTYRALCFICPGCEAALMGSGLHMLPVDGDTTGHPAWVFDGNLDAPTLSPSVLTKYGDDKVCHSFIRNGSLEFLNDCTHELAGRTVPLPPLPDWVVN